MKDCVRQLCEKCCEKIMRERMRMSVRENMRKVLHYRPANKIKKQEYRTTELALK